jgi:outer membrane scaffolding protein for murein synthesis (MipA/OmpV family)
MLAFTGGVANAEQLPLWEVGVGVGALLFPDYRGSDEAQVYPIPVPYVVYRGKFLKADPRGLRGVLLDRTGLELNISVNATVPVRSDDNEARRGMPDLSSTLEVGPSLDLQLWQSQDQRLTLDLMMPLRLPLTLESSPQVIGWIFSPRLNLDIKDVDSHIGWNLGVSAGPVFAGRKYHEYFYSVAPEFATATRPEYTASEGYSGAHMLVSLSKRFPKYWIGTYMRYDALVGAASSNSSLVKQRHSLAVGVGIAWMIGRSTRLVEREE